MNKLYYILFEGACFMMIFVFRLRSAAKIAIGILILVILIAAISSTTESIGVFSQSRQLPIYSVDCSDKKAAITFDCAWGAEDIPSILKTLKEEDVKATFFIVGQWAEKYPQSVKMIADGGHDVANHSYSHLRMGSINRNKISSEISICGNKLGEISGKKVNLFRAPYGDYNDEVIKTAKDLGYYTIQWDVDSLDWKPGISKEVIMSRIDKRIKPGSIILFHNDTPYTAQILPNIIKKLKKEDYKLVPVSELIIKENYRIDLDGKQKSNG